MCYARSKLTLSHTLSSLNENLTKIALTNLLSYLESIKMYRINNKINWNPSLSSAAVLPHEMQIGLAVLTNAYLNNIITAGYVLKANILVAIKFYVFSIDAV